MSAAVATPSLRALAAVFAVAALAHAATLGNGFVFDDTFALVNNAAVNGAAPWTAAFSTDFWGFSREDPGRVGTWRPLVVLLSRVVYRLGGGAPGPLHLANLLLHALACVALATAVARHVGSARVGLVTGGLFATLAVNTEAVAGLVGSADLLSACFCFTAWACLGAPTATPSFGRLVAVAAATLGAGLSKESALAFPALLLLVDGLAGAGAARLLRAGAALAAGVTLALAARWAAFGGFGLVTATALDNPLVTESLGVRASTGLALFARATGLVLAPFELSPDYSFDSLGAVRTVLAADVLLGAGLVAGLLALALLLRTKVPGAAAAGVLLPGAFFVVSNVPVLLPSIFAERLLYLPAAGAALGLALAFDRWAARRGRLAWGVLAVFVSLQAARGVARDLDWRDDLTLFGKAVETQPRCARAWTNLGHALAQGARHEEAVAAYRAALEVVPGLAATHTRAGVSLDALGRPAEAEAHLREAARLAPLDEMSVHNYAVFLVRNGRAKEAAALVRPLVDQRPSASSRRLLEAIEALPASRSP